MTVSRDTYCGRCCSHLVVVHRLSLVPQEQLQEEDKQQGKGVVKTTGQSMSLHSDIGVAGVMHPTAGGRAGMSWCRHHGGHHEQHEQLAGL